MPEIRLTPEEQTCVETAAAEVDATTIEFFADAREALSSDQWNLLISYARACIRRALEIGTLLHGVVDSQCPNAIPYPGRGRDVFLRGALAAWKDSFAPIRQVWELAPVVDLLPGGEQRLAADVGTLEVMAANRAFGSLDAQCAAMLGRDV